MKKFLNETFLDCARSLVWFVITICCIIEDIIVFIDKTIRKLLYVILKGLGEICFIILFLCRLGMKRLVR